MSTAGAINCDKIPASISNSFRTYLGPTDGLLWFSDGISTSLKIGRITTRGVAASYNLSKFVPARQHFADSMAIGQDDTVRLDPERLVEGTGRPRGAIPRGDPASGI